MEKLQFGDFVFEHNPRSIKITHGPKLGIHFCVGKGSVVQNLGKVGRQVVCEGSLFAFEQAEVAQKINRLKQKADEGRKSMLFLPFDEPFLAELGKLDFSAVGDGRVIDYRVEFLECARQ